MMDVKIDGEDNSAFEGKTHPLLVAAFQINFSTYVDSNLIQSSS